MAADWKKTVSRLGTHEHVEAVGALALFYNQLEIGLWKFFRHYLRLPPDAVSLLFSTLNNRQRTDLIRQFSNAETKPGLADAIDHELQCYDICVENRNLILHALPGLDPSDATVLNVLKASKTEPNRLRRYHFTLDDIRNAALSMYEVEERLGRIWLFMIPDTGDLVRPSLPGTSPKPRKLSLSQLVEDP